MIARSITKRWIINGLGLIFIILLLLEILGGLAIHAYYYNSVSQQLHSQLRMVNNQLINYSGDSNISATVQVRNVIENFTAKDSMELMAINSQQMIIMTSSGFTSEEYISMPDYEMAITSDEGYGSFIGRSPSGEKIMALCSIPSNSSNELAAVRVIVSMERVDSQIFIFLLIFILMGLFVLLLVIISGTYFINSIVIPVGQVGQSARKIASGDFNIRLQKQYDDEIGDLCDTINYMAEELQESDNIKNEFISSVSHELRTPLTAIRGWGETVLSSGSQEEELTKKGMRIILDETERLSEMVEELLDFSRIQRGNFAMNKGRIDVLAELGEAVLMFTQRAKQEEKELQYEEPDTLAPVYGDKNRLKQVFVNVLDNALKYTQTGGKITVTAVKNTNEITIVISDNGCGIRKDDLARVKQKFYKANHTQRGSGIGLAVADEIIRLHDGELNLDSKEGAGTKVTIKLPLLLPPANILPASEI